MGIKYYKFKTVGRSLWASTFIDAEENGVRDCKDIEELVAL